MNEMQGINGYPKLRMVGPPPAARPGAPPEGRHAGAAKQDRVEISQVAQFMSEISQMPQIRQEKVDEIRQMLADDSYDVDGRLSEALDRFLEEYT